MGAELFSCSKRTDGQTDRRTDRRTDVMKLIVDFVNFSNVPKNRVTTENMTGAYSNLTESVAHPVFFVLYTFTLYLHVKRFY